MDGRKPAGNRLAAAVFFILILLLAGIIPGGSSVNPEPSRHSMVQLSFAE